LFNLSVKHLICKQSQPKKNTQNKLNRLIDLSVALASIYDVEAYNMIEAELINLDEFIPFVRELALFDSMFTLTQLKSVAIVPKTERHKELKLFVLTKFQNRVN